MAKVLVERSARAAIVGGSFESVRLIAPLHPQREPLRELAARLGQDTVASLVLIADLDGQPVAYWHRMAELDVAEMAALSMGGMLARQALGTQLGSGSPSPLMTHEYDGQILLTTPVAGRLALMVLIEDPARLGLTRLSLRRAVAQIEALLGSLPAVAR